MTSPLILRLQSILEASARGDGPTRVLEAGCGSLPMALDLGEHTHIVGIDISEEQLQRNNVVDEKINADLQSHPFPPEAFDLIICWDVLEHLEYPDRALENFRRATAPGGLIVLKLPNVLSAKGLVTKFTPHRFHVWVYRRLLQYPNAGKPGFTPFPTHMRWSIAPHRLVEDARRHGYAIEYMETYEADRQTSLRRRVRLTGAPWAALVAAAHRATRSRLDLQGTELVLVMKKTSAPPPWEG